MRDESLGVLISRDVSNYRIDKNCFQNALTVRHTCSLALMHQSATGSACDPRDVQDRILERETRNANLLKVPATAQKAGNTKNASSQNSGIEVELQQRLFVAVGDHLLEARRGKDCLCFSS